MNINSISSEYRITSLNTTDPVSLSNPISILEELKKNNAVKDLIPRNLDFLLKILKLDEEKFFNENYNKEILLLRKLADEIIVESSQGQDRFSYTIRELQEKILFPFIPGTEILSKNLREISLKIKIQTINQNQLHISELFGKKRTVDEIINQITENPHRDLLAHADFSGLNITDEELQILLNSCPRIKYLNLSQCSKIKGATFNYLPKKLESLNISYCTQLNADSIKHVEPLINLLSLNIAGCRQFKSIDSLAHLINLQSLDISYCRQFKSIDSLAHLINLQSLNISYCMQLQADSLKHTKPLIKLQSLNIRGCQQFKSLKHITHLINLERLDISYCMQLQADSLKHTKPLIKLQNLNIRGCQQIEVNSMEYIECLINLLSLNISCCTQLKADALKYIARLKKLQILDISACNFRIDALESLKKASLLTLIIVGGNSFSQTEAEQYLSDLTNLTVEDFKSWDSIKTENQS